MVETIDDSDFLGKVKYAYKTGYNGNEELIALAMIAVAEQLKELAEQQKRIADRLDEFAIIGFPVNNWS